MTTPDPNTRPALAPAKINLFLHVGAVQPDGYHPLASLIAFADVGDRIRLTPADRLSLTLTGPFAPALHDDGDNLVLRALRELGRVAGIGEPPLAVTLDKALPIAAGLGGGSSDAGAALKLANRALGLDLPESELADIARIVGADGPMCLIARSAWAEGIGEVLSPAPQLPPLHAVLANPGRPSPTGAVYRAFDSGPPGRIDRPAPPADWTPATVIDWLARQRNDLQAPAVALEPAIGEALAAMQVTGARLTRMSGSGATVFGLFDDAATAATAADELGSNNADWWVRSTVLGGNAAKTSQ
ncbi:MAG: 4-(cytidine 5'-diphospho)-2-C-methyl-D-erythritol kinase [Caulobacteraceae bacterium]|nr:4-(cytidine 5'-diphospho)-2-C-methyl-D-erythritol kinase [Caulobacteraceae bacterium]